MISRAVVSSAVILSLADSMAFTEEASGSTHRFAVRPHHAVRRLAGVVAVAAPPILQHSVQEREGLGP
jgi:hypothetical protein